MATANTLARILSNVPPSRGGPTSLVIFDIHALQVCVPVCVCVCICVCARFVWVGMWLLVGGVRRSQHICTHTHTCSAHMQCTHTHTHTHTHTPQERFYFGDAVLPLFESGIPMLIDRLRELPDRDNVSYSRLNVRLCGGGVHVLTCTCACRS